MASSDRKRAGTLPLGTPAPVIPSQESAETSGERTRAGTVRMSASSLPLPQSEEGPESEDRAANLLPPDLPEEERDARSTRGSAIGRHSPTRTIRMSAPSAAGDSKNPPRMSRLSSWAGVGQRTTFADLTGATDRLTRFTTDLVRRQRIGYRVALAIVGAAAVLLLVALALTAGQWRWIPIGLFFLLSFAVITYASVRALLPRLARRFGEVELPGRAGMYLGVFGSAVASVAALVTWGASVGTIYAGQAIDPRLSSVESAKETQIELPPMEISEPPQKKLEWEGYIWARPGKLYSTPGFHPVDGKFDIVLHFHGDGDLVEQSVDAAKLNALVSVINLSAEGSKAYEGRMAIPGALDDIVRRIEEKVSAKAGTELKVGRIALSSWSAGYGGSLSLLETAEGRERVDAVLVMDGIHTGFSPGGGRTVHPAGIEPFVEYAKLAAAGSKLMIITHSSIDTADYCSTTETANAILGALDLPRADADEASSPPRVTLAPALAAFPAREQNWLRVKTVAHRGKLHVYGCAGNGKSDHIAHLAQMSVTVLPELVKRWAEP